MEIKIEIGKEELKKLLSIVKPAATAILKISENLETEQELQPELPVIKKEEKPIKRDKQYTFTEVRSILTEKSRDGFTEQVKALVKKYGNGKLSEVKTENYENLVLEVQFFCRKPFTKDEVVSRVEELKKNGFERDLIPVFEHNFASGIEDLAEEHYASFMRDAWGLDHE